MKTTKVLALSLLVLLPFQNCGQDYATDKESYFTGTEYESTDCLSEVVDCGANPEFLQISLDLVDPADLRGQSSETITGRCNSGNYPDHVIRWEVHNSGGATINSGEKINGCGPDGMYAITIPFSNTREVPGQLYSFYVKIIGVENGQRFQNILANGFAEVSFSR